MMPSGPRHPTHTENVGFISLLQEQNDAFRKQLGEALERNVAQSRVVEKLTEFLQGQLDDEDCRLDHNGYCQTHTSASPCEVDSARKYLAELAERADSEKVCCRLCHGHFVSCSICHQVGKVIDNQTGCFRRDMNNHAWRCLDGIQVVTQPVTASPLPDIYAVRDCTYP